MKKILYITALLCVWLLSVSETANAMPEWRAQSLLYQFDFRGDQELFAESGEWIKKAPEGISFENVTMSDQRFSAVSGEWSENEDGILQTSEEAAAFKAVWTETCQNPILSAEITPQSEENCIFLYFSMQSDSDYAAVELSQNGSRLTVGGLEFSGGGTLQKDQKTTIRLEVFEDTAAVYQDESLILYQSGLPLSAGRVGFGSWATKMRLQNPSVSEQNPIGNGQKLMQVSEGESFAAFGETLPQNLLLKVRMGADNFSKGELGISLRTQENRDGYRIRLEGDRVLAYRRENGHDTLLAKKNFKMLSDQLYELSISSDGNNFSVAVGDQAVLSFSDNTFSDGGIGFFSNGTAFFLDTISIWRLAEVTVPVASAGNTVYYLDGISGDDSREGTSPETAWKTLDKLAFSRFAKGDQILFRRGCTYEGTLRLSGADGVLVSAWGEGEKPIILGCRNAVEISDSGAVSLSGLMLQIRHTAAKEDPRNGLGAALLLEHAESVELSDCVLIGSGEKTYTCPIFKADENSVVWCRSTISRNFGDNALPDADVPEEVQRHWAYPVMRRMVEHGVLQEYRPDDLITRAEFAVLLTNYIPLREDEYHWIFPDVSADFWGAAALQTIYNYRMLSEEMLKDGMALPDQPVTRAEAAAMLSGLLEEKNGENPTFSDLSDAPEWTREKILKACRTGLFAGRSEQFFAPNEGLTRAETAVLLSKLG